MPVSENLGGFRYTLQAHQWKALPQHDKSHFPCARWAQFLPHFWQIGAERPQSWWAGPKVVKIQTEKAPATTAQYYANSAPHPTR